MYRGLFSLLSRDVGEYPLNSLMMSLFPLKSVDRYPFNSLITSRNAEWVHLGSRRRQLDARRDRPPEDISSLGSLLVCGCHVTHYIYRSLVYLGVMLIYSDSFGLVCKSPVQGQVATAAKETSTRDTVEDD